MTASIRSATLGSVHRVSGDVFGDTWSTCEGPDGRLFALADDTRGFGNVCFSNLAVNVVTAFPPDLAGVTVNPMTAYGQMCETGPDLANWKGCGLTSVGNSFYLAVSRHHYMRGPFWQQEAWDSSIIRSDDEGQSWTETPTLGRAMFSGQAFATPFFIDYGQHVDRAPDGADEFVYALSSMGHWNNGHAMTLGRVARDRIHRLDPGDWQFAQGFAEDAGPDLRDLEIAEPVWGSRHDTALPVFQSPGRTGMAGPTWVPALGLYILPQWHFPYLGRPNPARWQHSRWQLFSAPAPWGPWTLFFEHDFAPEGFYNPTIPSRFVSDDGRRLWLLTCGDFATHAHYALHAVELTLSTEADANAVETPEAKKDEVPA